MLFQGSPLELAAAALFVGLLIVICVFDVRARRIPNPLTAVLAIAGLLFSTAEHPVVRGLLLGFGGLLLGFALWFPSYLFRVLGAGDVKLFAAAGAWLGPVRTLEAALIGGVVGGVLAILWMLRYRGVQGAAATLIAARVSPSTLVQPRTGPPTRQHLPYSIALSLGIIVAAVLRRHLF